MYSKLQNVLLVVCLFFSLPAINSFGQFLDEKEIDHETLFKEALSANGKHMNLSGKKIGDLGIRLLLAKPFVKKLISLDLRYNLITEKGAEFLAASPDLLKLKKLELRHNFLNDEGAVFIAESRGLKKLEKLGLGWNEIRDKGGLAIAGSNSLPRLKKLDLRGNFMAEKTKSELKKSLGSIKSLKLEASL